MIPVSMEEGVLRKSATAAQAKINDVVVVIVIGIVVVVRTA